MEAFANQAVSIFNTAKVEARDYVEAANIYRDLSTIFKSARNLAESSRQMAMEARKLGRGQKGQVKFVRERGEQVLI